MNIFMRAALSGAALVSFTSMCRPAAAQTAVGTISACYYSAECTYSKTTALTPPVDGPAFLFTNTGTKPITGGLFAIAANKKLGIVADHYKLPAIAPGKSKVIIVGASNDGKTHPAGGIFTFLAADEALDTSDSGPDSDTVTFTFTGKVGTTKVSSGKIVAGATAGPSVDGSVAKINFLGGPGNDDGPCVDCFASTQVATITTLAPGAR